MTEPGMILEGKYEILKEIGRGGMSVVYLAMDRRLNKQWAIKEIQRRGNARDDQLVVNSLLAEANLMKHLDHSALPRIVDIIDQTERIFVVMDYIEGESLDKILREFGAQPEELVINWAKQLCDALGYLHRQKPPIIYRDMKPSNVMLRPEGNIKIIDFGIAREYKEQNLADTTVLGTKGYAPPEQYVGQTDARSDIYALGMTMHHLLTGNDPRGGAPYAPVREWNPELSEGIDAIINRCVEPAPEHRYQSMGELLFDLEHPALVTRNYRKKQKRRVAAFFTAAALSLLLTLFGIGFRIGGHRLQNQDYQALLGSTDPAAYYQAIEIYPDRVYMLEDHDSGAQKDAYHQLMLYYQTHGTDINGIKRLANQLTNQAHALNTQRGEVAALYYDIGKLMFSEMPGTFKSRAADAKDYFAVAAASKGEFSKKELAGCYDKICRFMTGQNKMSERTPKEYEELLGAFDHILSVAGQLQGKEANYDRLSLYYTMLLFIDDQSFYIAASGVDQNRVLSLVAKLEGKAQDCISALDYVNELKMKIAGQVPQIKGRLEANYREVKK